MCFRKRKLALAELIQHQIEVIYLDVLVEHQPEKGRRSYRHIGKRRMQCGEMCVCVCVLHSNNNNSDSWSARERERAAAAQSAADTLQL